jgi:hypothetical protein
MSFVLRRRENCRLRFLKGTSVEDGRLCVGLWRNRQPTECAVQVDAWLEAPSLVTELRSLVTADRATGARIRDARIAALRRQQACASSWSADRDFSRLADLQ